MTETHPTGSYVLDASVTFAWCFEDEGDESTWALLNQLARARARVPGLWPLEVANVLLMAERRGRIEPARSARFIAFLDQLPIDIDPTTAGHATRGTLSLARAHGLSAYDAAYLELALREGLPLATRDSRLREAAEPLGVTLL